jgi:hypothetical protein
MRKFYHHTILNAESFLHTTAVNGAWCATIEWNNHRYENWHPGSGCQCSKRTVDWCGCSPLTVRWRDVQGVLMQASNRWHVRKVDQRIDMQAVSALEEHALGDQAKRRRPLGATFLQHLYWANLFHYEDVQQAGGQGWAHFSYFAKQYVAAVVS